MPAVLATELTASQRSSAFSNQPDMVPGTADREVGNVARCDDDIYVQDEIFEALVMDDAAAEHRGEPVFSELVSMSSGVFV